MNKVIIKNGKINWICLEDKCPQNCCGPFEPDVSKSSLWDVGEELLPLLPEDYEVMEEHGFEDRLVKANDGGFYIQTNKDGSCPFLKNNKCSIYNKFRLSTCMSYPFSFSKYNGLYADMNCHGWGKGWTSMEKVRIMVKELIKVYRLHIKQAENNLKLRTKNDICLEVKK